MDRHKQSLENWVNEQLYGEQPNGRVVRFELRHLPLGQNEGKKVRSISVPAKYNEYFGDEVTRLINATSEADASGIGGVEVYVVQCFVGTLKNNALDARFTFRKAGTPPIGEISSEPPTNAGLLAQTQRHLEAVMRINTLTQETYVAQLAQENARLSRDNEQLLKQRMESLQLIEELQSAKHERELDLMREERHERTLEAAIEKVSLLVPVVANKLTNQKLLPAPDTRTKLIAAFVHSLNTDQLAAMQQILTPEQLIAFASAAESFARDNESEENKKSHDETSH